MNKEMEQNRGASGSTTQTITNNKQPTLENNTDNVKGKVSERCKYSFSSYFITAYPF